MFSPFTVLNRCISLFCVVCIYLFVVVFSEFLFVIVFSNQRIADYGHLPTLKLTTTLLPLFLFPYETFFGDFEPTEKKVNVFVISEWSKVANFRNWWKSQFRALEKIQFVFQLKQNYEI